MTTSRRNQERVLDKAETELVDQTRHPALGGVSDKELSRLVKLLRERRDRARDIARAQRRKGKSEAKDGAERGNKEKMSVLAQALQRANKEAARRGENIEA